MDQNDQLIDGQVEVGNSIVKIGVNFGKDSESRKDAAYINKRLELLRKYWIDFKERHSKIVHDPTHEYYQKDYFGSINRKYDEIKAILELKLKDIELKSAIASTSTGSTVEIDVEQKRRYKKQETWIAAIYSTIDKIEEGQFAGRSVNYTLQIIKGMSNYWDLIMANHADLVAYATDKEATSNDYWKKNTFQELESMYYESVAKLEEITDGSTNRRSDATNASVVNTDSLEMQLPRIQIPSFNGNYASWISFKDLFLQTIHCNGKLGNAQKMHYLKTLVNGEAMSVIKHLPVTAENYQPAWNLLESRYDNQRLLVNTYLQGLMNQSAITTESSYLLKRLHDTTLENINALKQLKINIESWDPIIIYIISQKLDKETIKLHEQQMKNPKKLESLQEFMQFLEMRFQALDTIRNNVRTNSGTGNMGHWKSHSNPHSNNKSKVMPTAHHTVLNKKCYACQEEHKLYSCDKFKKYEPKERMELVKRNRLCWNCFGKHNGRCGRIGNCSKCRGKHQTLLHEILLTTKPNEETIESIPQPSNAHLCTHNRKDDIKATLLATALVKTSSRTGSIVSLRALIDQGSQASFITEDAVQHLGLRKRKCIANISGLGSNVSQSSGIVVVKLKPIHPSNFEVNVEALVVKRVTQMLPNESFKADWKHVNNLPLADPGFYKSGKIDLLLGAEVFGEIILTGVVKGLSGSPLAQQTEFGWILSGKVHTPEFKEINVSSMVMQVDIDYQLQKFWEMEEVSDVKSAFTEEEIECETQFDKTTKRRADGRYVVQVPKRLVDLGQSRKMAVATLFQMERKFEKNNEFKRKYVEFMKEYKELGHMVEVPAAHFNENSAIVNYLPHHAVMKEDSSTTKLRVVFDASRKTSNNISLNGISLTGPKLQDDLVTILLRWRMYKIAMTADIEKMYRQIIISDEHQDLQRIVWRESTNDKIKDYKLTTVTYGTTSAPYLAIKTLQKLARDDSEVFPIGSKIALRDFYVDDLLTGADSIEEAKNIQHEIISLLKRGGFKLRKWAILEFYFKIQRKLNFENLVKNI